MKIVLKQCEGMGDWYTIVRAEHDGREWFQDTGPNSSSFMMSERLVPNACIEGNTEEMLAIAHAVKNKTSESFKRVAVHFEEDGVHLYSPKNSSEDGVVTVQEASEFADEVIKQLGE